MIVPVPVLVILGVVMSARTRLNGVVFGQPVSVPPLLLLFAVLLLALAGGLLLVVRLIIRDGLRLRPVYVITTLS